MELTDFELTPVDADELKPEEIKALAKKDEFLEDWLDRVYVVLPKIGYGLEVRSEFLHEPDEFKISPALSLELSAGTNLVQVSIDV